MAHSAPFVEIPGPSLAISPLPQASQLEVSDGAHFDIVIVGSGAGGGTLARHLAASGLKVLVLDKKKILQQENYLKL
jgi:NADPH-dependent 2,4-dienoyl-CoA reductase/sulfur reductase-like enzyme